MVVTIRATIDPLVPDRILITLAQHQINPVGEAKTETTSSISVARRRVEMWLKEFETPTQDELYLKKDSSL